MSKILSGVYIQKGSPFYYLRYYDRSEPDYLKRRKSFCTKVLITKTDLKKYKESRLTGKRTNITGNKDLKEIVKQFKRGLTEYYITGKTNINITKNLLLSEGLKRYIESKTRPGDKKALKPKTVISYQNVINHFIKANSDKIISKYTNETDYKNFLLYMEQNGFRETSRSSFTNQLSSLWNYFVKSEFTPKNIIEVYDAGKAIKPEDIPLQDFIKILDFYKPHPERYEIIYYLLLSMNRPSTALLQKRSDINFDQKYILMYNTKASRKSVNRYTFPLFRELEDLVKEIIKRPVIGNSDRLFSHFKIGNLNYTDSLYWFYPDQKELVKNGVIPKTYQIKQIRKTFPSYALNILGMSVDEIQFLLNHTDKEVTENYYLNVRLDKIRNRFESKRLIK